MGQVVTQFTTDDRDVMTALQRMHREMIKLREENQRLSSQGKNSTRGLVKGFRDTAAAIHAGTMAAQTMLQYFGQATQEVRKMRQEAAGTQFEIDKITRSLRIQAGLNAAQGQEAQAAVFKSANRFAVGFDFAASANQQLISSGFNAPEKTGTLDAFLAILASSNASPTTARAAADPVALAQASGQFLQAFGKEKSAANLLDLGVRVRGLFQSTDVQLGDLGEFAKAAPTLAGAGLSLEETLSTLAILRETRAPGEAATQVRNIGSILQTLDTTKKTREAAEGIGLDPADVDLEGETFEEALRRLNAATSKLGQAERAGVLTTLFGRENVGGAQILLDNLDRFEKFGEFQRDTAGFESGVVTATEGINAAKVRLNNRKQQAELDEQHRAAREELLEIELDRNTARTVKHLEDQGRPFAAAAFALGQAVFQDIPMSMGIIDASDVAAPRERRAVESAEMSGFRLDDLRRETATPDRNAPAEKLAEAADRLATAAEKQAAQGTTAAAVNAFKTQAE